MGDEVVVETRGVSKKYRVRRHPPTTLKSHLLHEMWRPRRDLVQTKWALQDVSFEVSRGEALGIVGRNGSGKSTLLKLLNGTLRPDAGSVRVEGRVAALIELGVGFHPELTGRENVEVTGIMLGMTKRVIRARMDEIIAFADIGDCLDDPIRTYSSGMVLRLGFSVATSVSPDVMLLDELFAVGDAEFAGRCLERMNDFRRRGHTIIVASHDLELVRNWCDRAIWLHEGRLAAIGPPGEVVARYAGASG
jgi:lipopolysaccharide transport system ATP-binding protein